jgi:MnmE helical domain
LLRAQLLRIAGWQAGTESIYLARERHLIALRAAQEHVALAGEHGKVGNQSLDLFAEELRLAQEQLNSITGEFTSDDFLGVIFSRFCTEVTRFKRRRRRILRLWAEFVDAQINEKRKVVIGKFGAAS